jgi:hypothetical protein
MSNDPKREEKIAAIRARSRAVTLAGSQYYVVEGDLLVDEDGLRAHLANAADAEPVNASAGARGRPLLGMVQGDRIVRWAPGTVLSYRVRRGTFDSDGEYYDVCASMLAATAAWEKTCGVDFKHLKEHDGAEARPAEVLFEVVGVDVGGVFIAAAFSPNDPPSRRVLRVDRSFFGSNLGFDRTGVLRHELGHVLGFRHEHIRSGAPAVCDHELTAGTIDLTQYDPKSVMHYFCGGVGSRDLQITDLDVEGAQRVYGLPLGAVQFVEG